MPKKTKEICDNCRFELEASIETGTGLIERACRRWPPAGLRPGPNFTAVPTEQPITANHWCGEWKPKEGKQ